jgi:threonine synthase
LLDVVMPRQFPWATMRRRPPGLWRYREALPLGATAEPVALGEPETPLVDISAGGPRVYLKLDFLFPTGSFKDRGAAVLMTKARELRVARVIEDSSGNAGAAIAAYAAAAAISAGIYVPEGASPAKVAQIQRYGASVVQVPGSRADTARAAMEAAQAAYYASHVWNPFFLEGTKTVAFELWEQLGRRVPDWVITPVGHGTMVLGLSKGFLHLRDAGMTDAVPRLVGVQAATCAPLVQGSRGDLTLPPVVEPGVTQADGIAVGQPTRWRQILRAIADSAGFWTAVSEEEIRESHLAWARRGLLIEPTSATATAAYQRLAAEGVFGGHQRVVVVVTGSGIKTASQRL